MSRFDQQLGNNANLTFLSGHKIDFMCQAVSHCIYLFSPVMEKHFSYLAEKDQLYNYLIHFVIVIFIK